MFSYDQLIIVRLLQVPVSDCKCVLLYNYCQIPTSCCFRLLCIKGKQRICRDSESRLLQLKEVVMINFC